jgi:hypothetical protein
MNRHYAAWSVEERKAHRHAWHRTMIVSTAVFGALWGSAGMIAFPGSPLEVKLLWTLAHVMLVAEAAFPASGSEVDPAIQAGKAFTARSSATAGCANAASWRVSAVARAAAGVPGLSIATIGASRDDIQ